MSAMIPGGFGPGAATAPEDRFWSPVFKARLGINAPVLLVDTAPSNKQYVIDAVTKAGRTDLLPGVEAWFTLLSHIDKEAFVTAVKVLITPAVVSQMSDDWKREMTAALAGYFPPAA